MRVFWCFLLAAFAAMPIHAQDDIEARLRKLEAEVEELKQENAQLRKDLGTEVVTRQADVKEAGHASLQVGGLIQAQSEAGDKGDSRFSDANTRVSSSAPTRPATIPAPASDIPCAITIRKMFDRDAPNAIRTPRSCVPCVTRYDITP